MTPETHLASCRPGTRVARNGQIVTLDPDTVPNKALGLGFESKRGQFEIADATSLEREWVSIDIGFLKVE
jgi:hypothetical protein